jgi:hypothetical protein
MIGIAIVVNLMNVGAEVIDIPRLAPRHKRRSNDPTKSLFATGKAV